MEKNIAIIHELLSKISRLVEEVTEAEASGTLEKQGFSRVEQELKQETR